MKSPATYTIRRFSEAGAFEVAAGPLPNLRLFAKTMAGKPDAHASPR